MNDNRKDTIETGTAKIISYLLHPLLMPALGLFIIFNSDIYFAAFTPDDFKLTLYGITLLFTLIMPVANALFLFKSGYIKSITMDQMEERKIPYLITAIFFGAWYYLLHRAQLPQVVLWFAFGATLSIVLAFVCNFFWKISAHLVGAGGITGTLIAISYQMNVPMVWQIVAALVGSGLIGFARLKITTHRPAQIYGGFLLGFFCELVMVLL
jgi:hypothetical protein